MATTMSLIAKQTVGSGGTASVTFSNIPQTFTDLKIVISARGTTSGNSESIRILPNGSSSSLTFLQLQGTGSGVFSGTGSYWYLGEMPASTATSSTFGSAEIYIPNYRGSNDKSASSDNVHENNTATAYINLNALLWSNTAAITSLVIQPNSNNFVEFSTFYLYGISSSSTQNTSVPAAYGGDVITTDGTYWYHAFKYSGTFTPLKALNADVLCIAGGGGGGYLANSGFMGGGGAGGLTYYSNQSLVTTTNYSATVGSGGSLNTQGNNSQFGSLTASVGGGRGGATGLQNAGNGGSGGGGGEGSYNPAGTGTSGQGNNGGVGVGGSTGGGGGGGGAGAVGSAAVTGVGGGAGGAGVTTYSSWGAATLTGQNVSGTYWYAGGGGGTADAATPGAGGNGGGGTGADYSTTAGVAGIANTGGGGGGGGGSVTGGTGGSGIIIVRYLV